jgi:hypothetical protein
VTAGGRELIFREQLTKPHEDQPLPFQPDEPHPAKFHSSVTARVVGENDLIGRQRHPKTTRKDDEGARRTVADDWKRRGPVLLSQQSRRRGKIDEDVEVRQLTDATIPATWTTLAR